MTDRELMERARLARRMAYTPYSHFNVGAALLTENGTVYTGCNIESVSYSPTNCAERTAVFKAVSEGERRFKAIAVTGGPAEGDPVYTTPCGVCRQVLAEFGGPDLRILLTDESGQIRSFTLAELLPETFWPEVLLGAGEETEQ